MASSTSNHTEQHANSRKQPRHFHQGPDPQAAEEKEEEEKKDDDGQPPVARLYRHALESIFDFLSLKDLSAILAVSHSWSAAVGSMRNIDATLEDLPAARPLHELCASQLAHHIGTLGSAAKPMSLSQAEVYLAGFRMTGLHTLYFKLPSPLVGPLLFPSSLVSLIVDPSSASAHDANLAIVAASRLPKLHHLNMGKSAHNEHLSFAPLRRSTQLQCLHTLSLDFDSGQHLSPQQADDLRAIPNLTHLDLALEASDLRLLLRAPHQLKLHTMAVYVHPDGELAGLLASLTQLSRLVVYSASDIIFLNSLPTLCTLRLFDFALHDPLPSPEQLIAEIGKHAQITDLTTWTSQLTSAHVRALLSRMPAVRKLKLEDMAQLESLSFLSSKPLASTLTSLTLKDCRHPRLLTQELRHLYSLPKLTDLTIQNCFLEGLDSFTVSQFQPPSRRLPKLRSSVIECAVPAAAAL